MNIKLIYTIAMAVHGVGHVIGLMIFLNLGGMSVRSSILDSMGLNEGLIRTLSFIWIIPFVTFIAVAWGVWNGATMWNIIGWGGTAISVIYLILYWNSFPSNIPIQANIGNVVVWWAYWV